MALLTLNHPTLELPPNVKGIGGIDFSSGWDKRRWVLLLVDYVPIKSVEKCVLFELIGSIASTAQPLVNVSL